MSEAQKSTEYKQFKYLIDGFPRNIQETEVFEDMVGEPDAVLWFNASE